MSTNTNPWVRQPGPHKFTLKSWLAIGLAFLIFLPIWLASQGTYSEQPRPIAPAPITGGQGLQATVRANSFTATTNSLMLRIRLKSFGGLVNARGMLTSNIEIRVVDDVGINLLQYAKGQPLSAVEVALQTDGDVTQYPFDKYSGDFSLLAEIQQADGAYVPLKLSVGTEHAETGWFTRYTVSPEANDEAKVTIVAMKREPFHIAFALLLAFLLAMLAIIAIVVGFLCITNRRASDPGVVGGLVGILFSMPFARRLMPGDPPIGCALDVQLFAWSIVLCSLAIVLAMIAWLRQSRAAHHHP